MMTTTAARPRLVRARLKATLESAAARPETFRAAVVQTLGLADAADIEALRARVRSGEAWLPRLALLADPALFGRDAALTDDGATVLVHEDLAHDEARIAALYRAAVRQILLPIRAAAWTDRALSWLRAA